MSSITDADIAEIAWFGALCDDDYEFLGVPDPAFRTIDEPCSHELRNAGSGTPRYS